METKRKKEVLDYLFQFVTENKKEKIANLVLQRTRHVTVVLEDIFQSHNASAIIRSAECFGIQDVHVIEKQNIFSPVNTVAKGAAKWINFKKYKKTGSCLESLKKDGYKIIATTAEKKAHLLHELPIDQKIALVFGTESTGLSDEAINLADEFVTIPMYGFTESFNVSVSVAICLYDLISRLRNSDIDWRLSDGEILDTKLAWARAVLPNARLFEERFLLKKSE